MSDNAPKSTANGAVSEAQPNDNEYITKLCHDMFAKTADYLNGEFESTSDEYRLLEQMNRATLKKYVEMKDISSNISKAMMDLNEKYNGLMPYLEMIDQLDDSIASLEQAAYKLDAYSKRLESKFKQLEKS